MTKHTPLIEPDGEVRELKTEDIKRFSGAASLPQSL